MLAVPLLCELHTNCIIELHKWRNLHKPRINTNFFFVLNAPFYACLQVLQTIYKTKRFDWPSRGETPADIEVGGDQPWIRRMVGISTCPQVASLFNEAVQKDGEWVGPHIRRTLERAREHWDNFFVHNWGSLLCAGYSTEAILLIEVTHICLCILHLCMAMGRLLAEFTQSAAAALPVAQRGSVRDVLLKHKAGLALTGSTAIDGEETHRLFAAWEELHQVLHTTEEEYRAIKGMHELLRALYRTFPDPTPP